MPTSGTQGSQWGSLSFGEMIGKYSKLQEQMVKQVQAISSNISAATPGRFLLLQFGMAQVTQVGDSISNLISQVNSMIGTAVRNQKTQ